MEESRSGVPCPVKQRDERCAIIFVGGRSSLSDAVTKQGTRYTSIQYGFYQVPAEGPV